VDQINPPYYSQGGIESIHVIEAFVPDKPYRWAPLKYLFRAGKKPGQDEIVDLEKAIWWIKREISVIQQQRQAALEQRVAEVAARAPGTCPDIDQEYEPTYEAVLGRVEGVKGH
jgi:hypothetical protein